MYFQMGFKKKQICHVILKRVMILNVLLKISLQIYGEKKSCFVLLSVQQNQA